MSLSKKSKILITTSSLGALTLGTLLFISLPVVIKDPYMYYRHPDSNAYNFALNNFDKNSTNNGIIRYSDYDSIILGSEAVEGFSVDDITKTFKDSKFINVSFSSPSFKETNQVLSLAFNEKKTLKNVVRSIETDALIDMDTKKDNSLYPDYLYDNNWANDICYVFNPSAIKSSWDLIMNESKNKQVFDKDYNIKSLLKKKYGSKSVLKGHKFVSHESIDIFNLTNEEKRIIQDNIETNLIDIARKHPETTFTYFVPPSSLAYYGHLSENNRISRIIGAKKILYEACLDVKNIHLYDFDNFISITSILDNYFDDVHYGPWINRCITEYFSNKKGLIDSYNYKYILNEIEVKLYRYDYYLLNNQEDIDDAKYIKNFTNPY